MIFLNSTKVVKSASDFSWTLCKSVIPTNSFENGYKGFCFDSEQLLTLIVRT